MYIYIVYSLHIYSIICISLYLIVFAQGKCAWYSNKIKTKRISVMA